MRGSGGRCSDQRAVSELSAGVGALAKAASTTIVDAMA